VPSEKFLGRFGGVEQHHFARKNKYDISVIISIAAFAKKHSIDLIQSQLFMDNQIARFAGLLSRVPVVTSVRGEIGPLIGHKKMWFELKAQLLSEKIVVNSDWLRRYLLRHGVNNEKIVVIYNGVDYSRLICKVPREELRIKYNIPENNHVITIVARLHPMKDHITFLRAISLIKETLPKITVLIVGDGDERKSLEAFSNSLMLHNIVRFLGNIEENINEIYRITDLLMLTSECGESFPNVILEAMSVRVPVVASNISAVNEIIDDNENGFLVESKDVENYSKKAIAILSDKNISESIVSSGRKKVESFNIPSMVIKYEDLYQRLLAN